MVTQVTVDVSMRGQITQAAAIDVDGRVVVVDGRFFRVARVYEEKWSEDELGDLRSFLGRLSSSAFRDYRIHAFSFAQKLPHVSPKYDYLAVPESVAAIPITTYQEWMDGLQRDSRTDVRKAAKRGVAVRVSDLDDAFVQGIVALYNEAPARQGKRFWHYGKQADAVRRENATYADRGTFLGAYLGSELIGFMKIVRVGQVGVMMQILSRISHRDYRVSNALVAEAVRLAEQRNWLYLTYGQYRYRNRDSSLTRFKHRAGFQEYLLPRYYIPLNRWGRVCLRLGLHRDLVDMVPSSIATAGGYVRAAYTRALASRLRTG